MYSYLFLLLNLFHILHFIDNN